MVMKQAVQELKAERVQEEITAVPALPVRVSLKAERVQEPVSAPGLEGQETSGFELNLWLRPKQPVKIELTALETIITI